MAVSPVQKVQLQAQARVKLESIRPDSRWTWESTSVPLVSNVAEEELKQKIYITNRTRKWMVDNIVQHSPEEWQFKVWHWKGFKKEYRYT